jgi:hypothetical protein
LVPWFFFFNIIKLCFLAPAISSKSVQSYHFRSLGFFFIYIKMSVEMLIFRVSGSNTIKKLLDIVGFLGLNLWTLDPIHAWLAGS